MFLKGWAALVVGFQSPSVEAGCARPTAPPEGEHPRARARIHLRFPCPKGEHLRARARSQMSCPEFR